jgi:hypothetical protein
MRLRIRFSLLMILGFASLAVAGDKKKIIVPAYVLHARTVLVIIQPGAGENVTTPRANQQAREDVEQALMKWGRFSLVLDGADPDLIITVKKGTGKMVQPTIGGLPNDRPVILQPTDNGGRVGAQQGRPPGSQQPFPQDTSAHPQTEVGAPDDILMVFDGRNGAPQDGAFAWRYTAKDALRSPDVPAVAEFRKAIEEALKQQQQQQTKGKP